MRVLLADDHSIVRRGMRSLLETEDSVEVVAEASDGLEALRLCEEHHPDLLILDVAMPKLNGIDVAARSQKMDPPPQAIMLSMHLDESYVMRSINAGARGYLLKDATDEDLLPAIRAVVECERQDSRFGLMLPHGRPAGRRQRSPGSRSPRFTEFPREVQFPSPTPRGGPIVSP